MIAASAPAYPHGIIDPIEKIGELAALYNLPFHVDACYGGFMLPWSVSFSVQSVVHSIMRMLLTELDYVYSLP